LGSVKDLETVKKPTENSLGVGRFHFSDRYSVFDWGEMPDQIEGKGASLCLMGAYCFEKLEEKGIKTHYRGVVAEDGKVSTVQELKHPANIMEISLVNVLWPQQATKRGKLYDYGRFTPNLTNFLIPLEIIYRNGLPEGSSVFKRLREGTITIEDLGLDHYPKPGERLTRPIFDVSTKLEEADRYLTWEEAREISGMTTEEIDDAKTTLLKVDNLTTQIALKADLENEDGKIELGFDPQRKLMVVDVVGTLDECRFTYEGMHVSKEIARRFYRNTRWYKDVEDAKKRAEEEGTKDWKRLCRSNPPKIDVELKNLISQMYMAVANAITERNMFEVPDLADIFERLRRYQ
jgi:phosphoribosylaminoimidazole-succinocarboxamide synthase